MSETFYQCPNCSAYVWREDGPHRCPPKWSCAEADSAHDPDEWTDVHGDNPEDAAERFARKWDRDDGPSADGEVIDVAVRDGDRVRWFTVAVSWTVTYNATEVRRGR